MKNLFFVILLVNLAFGSHSQTASINWLTWDQAITKSKIDSIPKKMFIDFYTGWCGWCKRMDATTFKDPNVVGYMNANFYAVKFDAETLDTILFNGSTFINSDPNFKKQTPNSRGKVHQMAYGILDGKLSYPSYAILDENQARLVTYQGAKPADQIMGILLFFETDQYKYYHNYLYGQWNKQISEGK
ncbi:DUF255 domain-containing protein [Flavobacteriales bacterium]|nr:DUF255 domain-containing protein [Flavobacteriales bacterium]